MRISIAGDHAGFDLKEHIKGFLAAEGHQVQDLGAYDSTHPDDYPDFAEALAKVILDSGCDKALFGWPCDAEMEKLRDDFARETDPVKQKAIAEAVQVRLTQYPTHIFLGQWYQPAVARKNTEGYVVAPATVFWNVSKTGR